MWAIEGGTYVCIHLIFVAKMTLPCGQAYMHESANFAEFARSRII